MVWIYARRRSNVAATAASSRRLNLILGNRNSLKAVSVWTWSRSEILIITKSQPLARGWRVLPALDLQIASTQKCSRSGVREVTILADEHAISRARRAPSVGWGIY